MEGCPLHLLQGIAFDCPYLKPPFLKCCIRPRNQQIWACDLPLGMWPRLSHQMQLASANHSLHGAFSVKCTARLKAQLSVAISSSYMCMYCTPVWCCVNVPVLFFFGIKNLKPFPFWSPFWLAITSWIQNYFDNVMAKIMTHEKLTSIEAV